MAIHKKRETGAQAAARQLLESSDPVELPPAEIDEESATIEREEFRPYLDELFDALEDGGTAQPAPIVQSDSIFVIEGDTRTFWVRLWHTDDSRTRIARVHVVSCLPRLPNIRVDLLGNQH